MSRTHTTARAALLLIVTAIAASCADSAGPGSPTDAVPPEGPSPDPAIRYAGIPFGPCALYTTTTELAWRPGRFATSLGNAGYGNAIVNRINAARQERHRLVSAMAADRQYYIT